MFQMKVNSQYFFLLILILSIVVGCASVNDAPVKNQNFELLPHPKVLVISSKAQ